MKVAIGQINPTIGDFDGNVDRILDFSAKAMRQQADLIVFPEMSLCGYPPMDLLEHDSFVESNLKALDRIQNCAPAGIALVVGYVDRNTGSGKGLSNKVALIQDSKLLYSQAKTLLPDYDVFDETRYFEPAREWSVFPFKGERLGLAICEDIWRNADTGSLYHTDPVAELLDKGATLIVVPSASPYFLGKPQIRLNLLTKIGKTAGVPVLYVNMVGGNDSLVFDGQSMLSSADGQLVFLARAFKEQLTVLDLEEKREPQSLPTESWVELEQALCLGLKDYVDKCGFQTVHVGLSGGIDSALVTALAARALGPERVQAFSLPSRYSSAGSKVDAERLASNLGIKLEQMPIEQVFAAGLATLGPLFTGTKEDVTEENLQARIRGLLLMAYGNKFQSLLLATGNKSELATGYCTLYGDMCGGLAVIGDLFKTEVYQLARSLNRDGEVIPAAIIEKVPSAELKPDQTDQDTLPPYELLDKILELHLIKQMSPEQMVESGCPDKTVRRILYLVERAEFKRRQAPPVLKVSSRAFGTGRRIPIARSF